RMVVRSRGEALVPSITVAERSATMSCASAVLAHKKTMAIDDASRRMIELSGWTPGDRVRPNGSRVSCGRLARRRKGEGRQSVPARAQHSASLKTITARQLQALVRRQPRVTAGAPWGGQWYRYQTFQPERNLLTNAWPWDR